MRKGLAVLLIVVLVGGAAAAGWWWARKSPEKATEILASGGLQPQRAEEFIAALGSRAATEESEVLVASGSIEGDEVTIVSEFGGRIIELNADESDQVQAGEVLVRLDASLLEAERAMAQAAVAAARAELENVKAGTHPAETLAARAILHQALAERSSAEAAVVEAQRVLDDPQELKTLIVEARTAVKLAQAQIEQARSERALAEVERDKYRGQGSMEEKNLYVMYDFQVQATKAAIAAARASEKGAQRTLAALKAWRDNPLYARSQLHMAEAAYEMAAAGVGVAKAKLDEVSAGPIPEAVELAEALVKQAESAVSAIQTQIDKMNLSSPIDGLVTSRSAHEGEAATAGATLLTVANLDEVTLRIYVPENKLGLVFLGQEVEVAVDSFPGRVFTGTVSHIAQQAEFTPKNVQTEEERVNMVFAVKVRLPNREHLLKPGMPADAVLRVD